MIVEMYDARTLARIINAAHRFGCTYANLTSAPSGGRYTATIDFTGPPDALRRLTSHITKLLHDDKEPIA